MVNGSGAAALSQRTPAGFNFRQIAQDGVQFADVNYKQSENHGDPAGGGNRADLLVKSARRPAFIQSWCATRSIPPFSSATPALPSSCPGAGAGGCSARQCNRAQFIPTAPPQPPFQTNITDAEVSPAPPDRGRQIKNPRVVTFASTGPPYAQHTVNGAKFDDGSPRFR